MCLVLESEVILANILSKSIFDHGINRNGLAEYCLQIKEELSKIDRMAYEYVYFDITPQSVKKAVEVYRDFFVELGVDLDLWISFYKDSTIALWFMKKMISSN